MSCDSSDSLLLTVLIVILPWCFSSWNILAEAHTLFPTSPVVLNNLGWLQERFGQPSTTMPATSIFNDLATIEATDTLPPPHLAAGNLLVAARLYHHALALEPNNELIARNLRRSMQFLA